MENRFFTPHFAEAMEEYPLYSQDGKGKDAICFAVFSLGGIRWYITEGSIEGNDVSLFGIVVGLFDDEYGYISLNELAETKVPVKLFSEVITATVEPVKDWKPCKLADIDDARLQEFLHRIHDREE